MVRRSRSSSSSSSSSSASSSSGSSSTSSATSSASSVRSRGRRSSPAGDDRRGQKLSRRRSASPKRSERKRSPSPTKKEPEPPTRITVKNLSRNVTKQHVMEIFGLYGTIKDVRLPTNYHHPNLCRGDATIFYEKHDDAQKAITHMDGAQIDGLVVSCEWVPPTPPRREIQRDRRSPIRGRDDRRDNRRDFRRFSPPRRNFGGRRSRSPIRRSRSPIRRSRSPIPIRRSRNSPSPPRRFRRSPPPSPGRRSPRRQSPKRRSSPVRRATGGNMIPLGARRRSPSS